MAFQVSNNIVILLATYNGEKYLSTQLDSLIAQTINIDIIIRDDNSSDNTQNIIKTYQEKYNNIFYLKDSKASSSAKDNFMILLDYAKSLNSYEYFMCCDQDDVWDKDKVEISFLKMLEMERKHTNLPLLIHSDLKVVDKDLNILAPSFFKYQNINPKNDTLNRVLLQNIITGCTMMLNKQLLAIIDTKALDDIMMHDRWIGLVAVTFGKIIFIDKSTILYRQHNTNDTGAKKYLTSYLFNNLRNLKSISLDKHIMQSKKFYSLYEKKLPFKEKKILDAFITIEKKSFFMKVYTFYKYKLWKQGMIRNIGLIFILMRNKI